ncbi:MAG: hypothetical protein JWO03_762 [Bacteroidetes bacterium]|nr:hypothetical protein [Bacteroidota bacterium]
MKKSGGFVLLAFIVVAISAFRPLPAKRVIFFGDSITQQGAKGNGYINIMHWMLDSTGHAFQYDLIGAGIGGNKIYDLLFRVDDDVIAKKPDIVYVFIGVNDVWAKTTSHTGTDPDRFDAFYDVLVKKLQKAGSKVVICTPMCIGEKKGHKNPDDADLDRYSQLARQVAYRNNCVVCDLRMLFFTWNEGNNPTNKASGNLTTDGVHFNDAGNTFVAKEMLKALPQ